VEARETAGAIMTEERSGEQHNLQAGTTAPLRLGIDLVLTSEIAKRQGVNPTTVLRWITKRRNPLPAIRVSPDELRAMGFQGNLSPRGAYLVRRADLALIPQMRTYPKGTKRPGRSRRATTEDAEAGTQTTLT